jgi:hypothetical protein
MGARPQPTILSKKNWASRITCPELLAKAILCLESTLKTILLLSKTTWLWEHD